MAEVGSSSTKRAWIEGALVFLGALLVLSAFTGLRPLFDADEGRYATVARNMLRAGDFVLPRLNGLPFLDKPPLVYWVSAAAIQILGPSPAAARTPTLLAGALWVLFAYRFARELGAGRTAARWVGLAAATSAAGIIASRVGPQMDMPLAAATAGLLLALWRRLRAPTHWNALGLGLAAGLGLLAKGPLAVAVPGLVGLGWVALGLRASRFFAVVFSPLSWAVALLLVVPWVVAIEGAAPGWTLHFLQYEHLGRFMRPDHRDFHPIWFYVPIALLYSVPWTPWMLGRARRHPRTWLSATPWGRGLWRAALPGMQTTSHLVRRPVPSGDVLWIWFLLVFVLYSVSTRKLLNYLLPAALPLLVLVGLRLRKTLEEGRRWPGVVPLLGGLGLVLGALAIQRSWWLPLRTGDLPIAEEAPRWVPLILPVQVTGAVLIGGGALFYLLRSPRSRAACLLASVVLAWWGGDCVFTRAGHLGAAEELAQAIQRHAGDAESIVSLGRYPQGLEWESPLPVWIAGGSVGSFEQREIVEPWASAAWRDDFGSGAGVDAHRLANRSGLLTTQQFREVWAGEYPVLVICRARERMALGGETLSGPHAGAGRTDLFVVRNRPPAAR